MKAETTVHDQKQIIIEDFYISAGEAIISYLKGEEPKVEAIDSDKVVNWIAEKKPNYLKLFRYYDVGYGECFHDEVELLKDFAERKNLIKAFLNDYLNK